MQRPPRLHAKRAGLELIERQIRQLRLDGSLSLLRALELAWPGHQIQADDHLAEAVA